MAAPAKFLFDTDFAAPDKARERAATATEIAQKIAEAEARAYRAGYEAAQHEARVESDRRSALALEEIGITIRGIATRFSGIEARMETEAVEVAVAVARKLCNELIARLATAGSNGPTAAWCWNARLSKRRSANSSGAIWRPAIRPERKGHED